MFRCTYSALIKMSDMKKKNIPMYEEREKFNVLAFFKLYILLSSIRIFIVHKILLLLKNT